MSTRDANGAWPPTPTRDGFLDDDPFTLALRDDDPPPAMTTARGVGARRSQAAMPGYIGLVSDEPLDLAPPMSDLREPVSAPPAAPLQNPSPASPRASMPEMAVSTRTSAPPVAPAVTAGLDGALEADQPVPRIRIHAACDRRDVARVIQAAAGDRRLAKAQISIELGGVEAALARLAAEPSPDLLILDTELSAQDLLRSLERLAEVVEAKCKVMIVGGTNDIALYRKLMQMGVSEYLVAPLEPVPLIRSIGALYTDPDKPFAGRVAAFLGARGGVGASSLAHNVAWAISEQQGVNVSLVDLDLPFGTAALDFNEDPAQSITDALAAADRVDEMFLDRVVTRPTQRLQLFSAPAKLERAMEMDPETVAVVLDKIRRTGPHIILDLPHQWNSWMNQTVAGADDIVIVASPDLSSLRNARHLVEFATKARQNDAPPVVVLNMVGMPKRPEIALKDFAEHVGAAVVAEIPFDPASFGAAMNSGQIMMEAAGPSKTAQAIAALASRLTGREVQAPKKSGLFDKIGLSRR